MKHQWIRGRRIGRSTDHYREFHCKRCLARVIELDNWLSQLWSRCVPSDLEALGIDEDCDMELVSHVMSA